MVLLFAAEGIVLLIPIRRHRQHANHRPRCVPESKLQARLSCRIEGRLSVRRRLIGHSTL
jgi:hypothetical protein